MRNAWSIVKLEDIASVERGKFSARPRNDPQYYGGDIPFLQTGDIASASRAVTTFSQTLNEEGLKVSRLFPAGTLLITIAANIGDVAEVTFDFACPDSLVAVNPRKGIDKNWLKYYLQTKKKYFTSRATENAQANINLQTIRPLKVELPPLDEQKRISNLLFAWDSVIEKTERLIEAKEKRYKWLLKELLNEKTVNDKWSRVKLGSISNIKKGQQLSVANMIDNGKYYVLNGGVERSGFTNEWNTPENTITISEGGNSCGFVSFNIVKFWCGGHCYALNNLSSSISNYYLYHFLKAHEKLLKSLRVGSGLPNIQKKDVKNFLVKFPSLAQQKKITETLNTTRKEIDLLKRLNERYKLQKRGLMQKLLTGQWRVK